jgi:ligand-binding sensor domain-containing protein
MIKYFIIVILLSINFAIAQHMPSSFYLTGEEKLYKTSSENPSGNSVSDIITVGDTIWIGSSKGVSLSTDDGKSWQNFYGNSAFGTESISAIGYDHGVFWAATAHSVDANGQTLPEGSGLKYTSDKGLTWNSIPQPIDNQSDSLVTYGINTLRALPVTVKVQNLIYDIAFTPGTIWIASFAGGLRKSTDMGVHWQRVVIPPDKLNSIKPTDTLDFCLQPVGGKFCSDNNLNYRVFSVISINDTTLYVGTAGGINKSTDGGISWTKFTHLNQDNPITGNFVVALAFDTIKKYVWAATWQAEGSTESYGVSFTADGGNSWNTSLDGERAHNFGFKQHYFDFKSTDVIALSDNGAFRSTNSGISWILPNSIYDDQTKITLTTSIYYAAASIVSLGLGINEVWLGSNDGLAKLSENPDPAEMWQGKWKIFRSSPTLAAQNQTYAYPNPFSPRQDILKIKYSTGGKSSNVTIKIFDFGMNYVRTVINNAARGKFTHVVDNFNLTTNGVEDTWDGRDDSGSIVPNGVYFYRVEFDSGNPVFGKILVLQ